MSHQDLIKQAEETQKQIEILQSQLDKMRQDNLSEIDRASRDYTLQLIFISVIVAVGHFMVTSNLGSAVAFAFGNFLLFWSLGRMARLIIDRKMEGK